MSLHHVRRGSGPPLLLLHGLGGSWRSWESVIDALAAERELILVDLPGHGETPRLGRAPTIPALADATTDFLDDHGLAGVPVAGMSMGARLALELARRRRVGATVALDPGGFWSPIESRIFAGLVAASIALVRVLQRPMPALTANPATRTVLFAQFSARPWALPQAVVLAEMRAYAQSTDIFRTLRCLVFGPPQEGLPAVQAHHPIVIGWGRRDRVTLPRQASRAMERFPSARLHWFEHSGHFPHWDVPDQAARLILETV